MAESFLSQHWYRVADLKPRLRSHARITRHRYWGKAWYMLLDRSSGRTHRFTPAAYLFVGRMNGKLTVDEIWREVAEALDEEAPSQDDIVSLLAQLHSADLIQSETPPDTAELFERYTKQSRQVIKQNLINPMSFRIPLIDPNRFLDKTIWLVRPFVGWIGMLWWLAVVVPALFLAGSHWPELTENIFDRVLAGESLLILAITYPS